MFRNHRLSRTLSRLASAYFLCIVVGFFSLIVLWKNNLGQIPTSAVYLPLFYTFLLSTVVFHFWLVVTRAPEKVALLGSATLMLLLFYGHLFDLVGGKVFLGISIGYVKLFLAYFILYAGACFWILRSSRLPNLWLLILPFGLVILFNAVSIASFLIEAGKFTAQPVTAAALRDSNEELPDIYYIVLDSYARDDLIRDLTGYDNSPFLNALKKRGFYVPECSLSNYNATAYTISSVLNMDSLDHLKDHNNLILDNKVMQIFRSYGYKIVTGRAVAPFYEIKNSDIFLDYAKANGFQDTVAQQKFAKLYLDTTIFRLLVGLDKNNHEWFVKIPLWRVLNQVDDNVSFSRNLYLQNNYALDSLESIPEKPGNYFVYVHIIAPHDPYTYNLDGSFRDPLDSENEDPIILYKNALIGLNQRVLKVIDTILAKSSPAPIILVQGDHAIHDVTTGVNKHKILSAYYLPGKLSTPPYNTITPVNNFRIILRNYFDPSVELVPDSIWELVGGDFIPIPVSCDR